MNWKGFGRKLPRPNFKVLSRYLPVGPEENHKNLSQDSGSPGRDLNPGPRKYEAGVLTTPLWGSVRNSRTCYELHMSGGKDSRFRLSPSVWLETELQIIAMFKAALKARKQIVGRAPARRKQQQPALFYLSTQQSHTDKHSVLSPARRCHHGRAATTTTTYLSNQGDQQLPFFDNIHKCISIFRAITNLSTHWEPNAWRPQLNHLPKSHTSGNAQSTI
jgi:hypothetical protein